MSIYRSRYESMAEGLKKLVPHESSNKVVKFGFLQFNLCDAPLVGHFLEELYENFKGSDSELDKLVWLLFTDERDILHLEDSGNVEDLLEHVKTIGLASIVKCVFAGDHKYRKIGVEVAKCPRCYRHVFEMMYPVRMSDGSTKYAPVCDRCNDVLKEDENNAHLTMYLDEENALKAYRSN